MDEALMGAAEYIDEYGWIRGHLSDADGRVCLLGAIQISNGIGYWDTNTNRAAIHLDGFLNRRLHGHMSIPYYNDYVCKDGAEASKLLREAAEWNPNDE
jgi:hypothetical protein